MVKIQSFLTILLVWFFTSSFTVQNNGKPELIPNSSQKQREISFKYLPDDILGRWWSPDKDGQIEFYKSGGKYFGRLIWSIDDKVGNPKLDANNPVVSMRSRRVVGMEVFKNLEYKDGKYDLGTVYDARSGYSYSCSLWLEGKDVLKVRGYLGFSMLGKTTSMTRVK